MLQPVISRNQPDPEIGEAAKSDAAAMLLLVVEELARELNPAHRTQAATLDSRLDRDLGIDSIGVGGTRPSHRPGVRRRSPGALLAEAKTPRDLLKAFWPDTCGAHPAAAALTTSAGGIGLGDGAGTSGDTGWSAGLVR